MGSDNRLDYAVLGPLEVRRADELLAVSGGNPRKVLLALLIEPNRPVGNERVIDALWGESPPAKARNALQVHVSTLRDVLEAGAERGSVISTTPTGYQLNVPEDALDSRRFERLGAEGRAALFAGDTAVAARLLQQAEGLRRGPAFADVAYDDFAAHEAARLEELRRSTFEDLADAELALGDHEELIPRLRAFVDSEPLRERARAQLMLALYRAGRQSDALTEYRAARETLVDEIGIEPGPALQALERAVLKQDESLAAPTALVRPRARRIELPAPPTPMLGRDTELTEDPPLLVLDNFEQLTEAGPLLGSLLAGSPEAQLLVTSRAVLHLAGEHEFPVGPLALPAPADDVDAARVAPAVALFVARAQAAKRDFELSAENVGDVVSLCAALDALPLAIELAAARVKILSPGELLERFGKRLELPAAVADAPERHRTLRAAIDSSYELLDDAERLLFARLSVFAGGWTLGAAEAVCSADGENVLPVLGSLADKSLVVDTGGYERRFTMLQIVHEYAVERLEARGEDEDLHRRHAVYFAGVAEEGEPELNGPSQDIWAARLDAERDNFRAALAFTLGSGDGLTALRLAGALRRLWLLHADLSEGRAALEAALAAAPDAPLVSRAKALNGLGVLAAEEGDIDAAEQAFEASLEVARELDDDERRMAG